MKILFAGLLMLHGLIHLMGFVKGFSIAPVKALSLPIGKNAGMFWLLAFLLFVIAAGLYLANKSSWWLIAIVAVFASQTLILMFWKDAKFGTPANVVILLVSIVGYAEFNFQQLVKKDIARIQSAAPVSDREFVDPEAMSDLPKPVQHWIGQSRIVGQQAVEQVEMKQDFRLQLKPEQTDWYHGSVQQLIWTAEPAFVWTLNMEMMPLVHIAGRDLFADGEGEMLIRIMSAVPIVEEKNNPKINQGALQRFLAEMVWYPSFALSERVSWEAIDEYSARASMDYKGTSGACTFFFDNTGMPKRVSAMRYRGGHEDAVLTEWVIDIHENRVFNGINIPVSCSVTWKLDSGDWTWATLEVTDYKVNPGNSQMLP